jgi:hypothetical protein
MKKESYQTIIILLVVVLVLTLVHTHRYKKRADQANIEIITLTSQRDLYRDYSHHLNAKVEDLNKALRHVTMQRDILNNEVANCHGRSNDSYVELNY